MLSLIINWLVKEYDAQIINCKYICTTISTNMAVAPAKLPEVKAVYEKNKRSNNIFQMMTLLDQNI